MNEAEERQRIVLYGAGKVGKTNILSRFLNNTFKTSYRETVEDLHCREYDIKGVRIKVDFLDTAGNFTFPAMRRLSISTAQAFLLVYAITDWDSFVEIKQIREQIKEQRSNYENIPCIIVGNKCDLTSAERQVPEEDVRSWLDGESLADCYLEVSAKEDINITTIFQKLLQEAKLPELQPQTGDDGQIRSPKKSLKGRRMSAFALPTSGALAELANKAEASLGRSRSLIKRRKSQPKLKDAPDPTKNDCTIS